MFVPSVTTVTTRGSWIQRGFQLIKKKKERKIPNFALGVNNTYVRRLSHMAQPEQ